MHHVTGELRAVGDDVVAAEPAIVADVAVVHQQVLIADAGDHAAAGGAGVERGELANDVVDRR